jgi:membrane-associated protease RseP (regulator of RpoE activity)
VREIHNGADDNASGTALILELARRMARRPDPLPRRLVFIAFAGEERGLLGSRHYVENPLFPLEQTVAMFNFDMVGRLNPARELTVFGAPTIEGLDALAVALAKSQGITANIVADTSMQFNASDHASFYRKNIPVFFPFTGTHSDYHRPGDDTEKINFEGMARIANLSELLLLDLARRPERPDFKRLPGSPRILAGRSSQGQGGTGQGQGGGGGAYFGSQPAYGVEVKGVKLDGVTEGSPADKAGLKAGDIIVKFGGQPVEDLESYMDALSRRKPGDMVEVVVLREGKETTLKATLGTRASPTN